MKNNRTFILRALQVYPFCQWCGRRVVYRCIRSGHRTLSDTATVDHRVPRSAGGVNAWSNRLLACYRCNQLKGSCLWADRTPAGPYWQAILDADSLPGQFAAPGVPKNFPRIPESVVY